MKSSKVSSILSASLRCSVAWSVLMFAAAAAAQAPSTPDTLDTSQPANAEADDEEAIIVTGTLVRGIAPPGTNVIGVSEEAVEESGATNVAQLLQTIPQLGSFNSLQYPSGGFNVNTTNRPNLRNLPGFTSSGGSPTLVLMDGHRLVGMGIQTTTPDPDVVPPGILERVEIVPDGGSAIYGSDAVAGVVNFITRRRFDGVEVDARYGFGIDYHTFDTNATVGKTWDSGSAYISYNYSEHDSIYGRDRDFVQHQPVIVGGVAFPVIGIRCTPGNVQNLLTGGTIYALPFVTGTAVANTANQCDESDPVTIYPKEHRHSVLAGVSYELSDSIELDVRGFYMKRKMYQSLGRNLQTQFIGPAFLGLTPSPFQAAHLISPASPFEIHQISFATGGSDASNVNTSLNTWGVTPTLTADLGSGWQLRALASYGESKSESQTLHADNSIALPNAIRAGLLNPYDIASSNPAAIAAMENFGTFGLSKQRQFNARLVVDGDLLTLPGGAVKLAAGVEYLNEKLTSQKGRTVPGSEDTGFPGLSINGSTIFNPIAPIPVVKLGRNVKAAFGELVVPIFGADNGGPGMEELTLSASGRYDDYSDVGGTFNPKFGVTYRPLDWVKLRGSWGKSFVAPSLADDSEADVTVFNWVSGLSLLFPPPALIANGTWPAPGANQTFVVVMLGSAPDIQPQKAKTLSLGVDLEPPFIPGLNVSATYWKIDYKGVISIPPFLDRASFWGFFSPVITVNPTQAQINDFLAITDSIVGSPCVPLPTCVYAIQDDRKRNLGNFKVAGLDLAASYITKTGFGSIDFAINANYELDRKQSPIAGAPLADLLAANTTRFRMRANAGAQIGNLRAQVTWYHTGGYDLNPPVGAVPPQQTKVSAFDVFNLFFKYDVPGGGVFQDLAFTLNIDNVFNQDPPLFRQNDIVLSRNGYANGATVGRLVKVGVSKKF